jgi:hypothetical protein
VLVQDEQVLPAHVGATVERFDPEHELPVSQPPTVQEQRSVGAPSLHRTDKKL